MARFYCMNGCSGEFCTSDRSPTLPHIVGNSQGCPHHKTVYDHTVTAVAGADNQRVCQKCGLVQSNSATKQSPKFNGGVYAIKCIDCNHPTLALPDADYLWYCIKCGRVYDSDFVHRHGNGQLLQGLVRCPKCGGSTRCYTTA
jgi:ribosomal protein S27E